MDLRPVWESPIKIKKGIDTRERLGEFRGEGVSITSITAARKVVD
jgi:hypothetical protein